MVPAATLNCEMAASLCTLDEEGTGSRRPLPLLFRRQDDPSGFQLFVPQYPRHAHVVRTLARQCAGRHADRAEEWPRHRRSQARLVRLPPARFPEQRSRRWLRVFHDGAWSRLQLRSPQPFPFRHQAAAKRTPRLPLTPVKASLALCAERVSDQRFRNVARPDR